MIAEITNLLDDKFDSPAKRLLTSTVIDFPKQRKNTLSRDTGSKTEEWETGEAFKEEKGQSQTPVSLSLAKHRQELLGNRSMADQRASTSRLLVEHAKQVQESLKQTNLGLSLESFKRQLASSYAVVGQASGEENFLSIVARIERTLLGIELADLDEELFKIIESAFQMTFVRPHVSWQDAEDVRRQLLSAGKCEPAFFDLMQDELFEEEDYEQINKEEQGPE